MEDYPRNLAEFERRFATEELCRDYLMHLRWPAGFRCPRCGGGKFWPQRVILLHCSACELSEFGYRGYDFPGYACSPHALVSGYVVQHQPKERNERAGSSANFGIRQLPDRLGLAAQIAPRYGAART